MEKKMIDVVCPLCNSVVEVKKIDSTEGWADCKGCDLAGKVKIVNFKRMLKNESMFKWANRGLNS